MLWKLLVRSGIYRFDSALHLGALKSIEGIPDGDVQVASFALVFIALQTKCQNKSAVLSLFWRRVSFLQGYKCENALMRSQQVLPCSFLVVKLSR